MLRALANIGASAPRQVSFCLITLMTAGHASAQLRTAVVEPSGDDLQLSRSLERVLRTRLDELAVGGELESSPLGWRDLELAAGCMGEDADCYAVVAAALGVDELVLASVEGGGDDYVLELVRWRASAVSRRVVHEQGTRARFAILDRVGPALRELYELPPGEPLGERAAVDDRSGSVDPTGPIVFGAVGLGSFAAGLALMMAFDASRAAWTTGPTESMSDVDVVLGARQRAERELVGAEVAFGIAAAALVTATVWLIVELTSPHGRERAASATLETGWRL
jgi:hypothetical protein